MKKVYWVIIGVAALLLGVATFFDMDISRLLYTPGSAFGQFFAVAAMVPIWFLVPIATGLMFGFLITQFPALNTPWRIICVALLIFGVYGTCERMIEMVGSRHLHGLPYGVLLWLVIGFFMLATVLGAYASRRYPKEVFVAAFVGIAAVAGSRFVLDHCKSLWGRQRFWTMDDPSLQFTPWYLPQFPSAERMAQMGDMIKSFPSGHSMGSISTLWLSLFPPFIGYCRKNLSRWVTGVSLFALVFWSLTIVSRVILGEHFLSDVTVSGIIFLLFFIVFTAIAQKHHPVFAAAGDEAKEA